MRSQELLLLILLARLIHTLHRQHDLLIAMTQEQEPEPQCECCPCADPDCEDCDDCPCCAGDCGCQEPGCLCTDSAHGMAIVLIRPPCPRCRTPDGYHERGDGCGYCERCETLWHPDLEAYIHQ